MERNAPKILFVTHKYPPSLGGMQQQSYALTRNYQEIGESSVIAYNSRYPVWLFFLIIIPWVAIRLIKDREIDVIHGNDGLMGIFLTPFLISRKKVFVTVHGLDVYLGMRAYQWWVRTFLKRFEGVIAVSAETAAGCVERGVPEKKVSIVLNACDTNWSDSKDPEFAKWLKEQHGIDCDKQVIVLSAGRPVPRKGFSWFAGNVLPDLPDDAIYAVVGPASGAGPMLQFLRKFLPDALFQGLCHAVGAETDYIKLKDISQRPELKGRVALLGRLPREHLNQIYLHSHIYVMPNLKVEGDFEGFGLVIQEATYNGALCLAADVDGIPSAIRDGETGILLPSGNAAAWTARINALCADPEQRGSLARRFQAKLRKDMTTWADVALAYQRIFSVSLARDTKTSDGSPMSETH
ncbi:glycosyltransferase family 4 protein [Cognatishimia activa]|uniref:glycosyltransferase family 4 protein n=1 Tax=Cognatishimia activa TaxID=1715691 RepID=UPI00222E0611|nr:glycosyltransferase family 4 protein [Cognatishimia activa]UZD90345.1 glycosyltransferase family 4 protein [Cognatishimia activa]